MMNDFSKLLYYISFIFSVLMTIFYFFNAIYTLTVPYKRSSEVIILLLSSVITGLGIYLAIRFGYSHGHIWRAVLILISALLTSLIWTFIGLFLFNGPINWQ